MKPIFVQAGDVFFTRSGSMLGKAIRWAETDPNEEPTWANHTGVVVADGWIGLGEHEATIIEALWKTRKGPLKVNGVAVRVFGPKAPIDKEKFIAEAEKYVGSTYGWWKLLFHLVDRTVFKGKKIVSTLLKKDKRPICSYLAAKVFASVGIGFGVEPQAATPDEMLDWCIAHPEEWEERF